MGNTKKTAAGAACAVSVIIGLVLGMDSGIRTSEAGLELIGNAESCLRDPYMCPARVLTVGIGSTGKVENRRYSDREIAERWIADIKIAEKCINDKFNGMAMNGNQFDAMVSAAFNMGCNGLSFYRDKKGVKHQTTISKLANAGDFNGMCHRLPDFVNAGGVKLKGLELRRAKEFALCTKS